MADQNNTLFTPQWWASTGITIGAGTIGGLRSFAETTIGNVPQARLAKTALQINSALAQGSLGAASGGVTGSVWNGLTSVAETTIGNVPQARLAKTALQINSALAQGSLGAASGGL